MSYATFMNQWFDQVWNQGNENAIDILLHEDAVVHGLNTEGKGPAGFKPFYYSFREAFPEVHVDPEIIFRNEDIEVANCVVTARNNAGKEVNFTGLSVTKFKDGQIIEAWNNFDFLTIQQQLGFKLVEEEPAETQPA